MSFFLFCFLSFFFFYPFVQKKSLCSSSAPTKFVENLFFSFFSPRQTDRQAWVEIVFFSMDTPACRVKTNSWYSRCSQDFHNFAQDLHELQNICCVFFSLSLFLGTIKKPIYSTHPAVYFSSLRKVYVFEQLRVWYLFVAAQFLLIIGYFTSL